MSRKGAPYLVRSFLSKSSSCARTWPLYRWTVSEVGSAAAFQRSSFRPHFWRILVELGVTWRPAPI